MRKEAIFHESESNYSFPISRNEVVLRLRVSNKDNFQSIEVVYGMKYDYHSKRQKVTMSLAYQDELFAYYEVKIKITDVRFVYVFQLETPAKTYYFCEDGVVDQYDFNFAYYNCFQIAYINDIDVPKKVSWMKDAVFYEIFVDRFNQGDFKKNQDYINLQWGDIPNPNSFAGGDLQGIIDKLDYLEDLGINVLYLTPIFKSISNHKYDISNYFEIDSQFGDEETFKTLVDKAHEKGIRIILDGVFNHGSDLMLEFQDVLEHGNKSKYFDWFIIHGDAVNLKEVNYETFANCYYHPKFNTSNKEVRKFLTQIAKHYIEKFHIDGWRLDVSDEVSHNFWTYFRNQIKEIDRDLLIIGENWHDAKSFLRGDQFDSIMNYAFTKQVLDFLAYRKISAQGLAHKLNKLLIRNTSIVNESMLNLLDTHDTHRFYTEVMGNLDRLLQALAIMFSFVGAPCIYYGTELPLFGGYDPDNRRCFDWNKLDPKSYYFGLLKALIKLRKNKIIQSGSFKAYEHNQLFVMERELDQKKIKLYVNRTKRKVDIEDGHIIVSHKHKHHSVYAGGFVIMEVNK